MSIKIYTYYENIHNKPNEQLLDIWKHSWESKGFEAKVLDVSDAEKNPIHEEFVEEMTGLIEYLVDDFHPRSLARWRRWLAYGAQTEERFYVSDNDLLNRSFEPKEILTDTLRFYNRFCPCFVSGAASEFTKLCQAAMTVTKNRLFDLKTILLNNSAREYNDQNFLALNFNGRNNPDSYQELISTYNFLFTRLDNLIGDRAENTPLIHLSQRVTKQSLSKDSRYTSLFDQKRIELALSVIAEKN